MDCRSVQDRILDALDGVAPAENPRELDHHLAGCPTCAAFAARQQALDSRLQQVLTPPELSPAFRTALRRQIRKDTLRVWADSLPDKVHFASCGLATVLGALFVPLHAAAILAMGAAATVVTYLLMAEIRNSLESSEDAQ